MPGVPYLLPAPDLQLLANDFLLRNYSPVAVLVSEAGDILYINGKTGPISNRPPARRIGICSRWPARS